MANNIYNEMHIGRAEAACREDPATHGAPQALDRLGAQRQPSCHANARRLELRYTRLILEHVVRHLLRGMHACVDTCTCTFMYVCVHECVGAYVHVQFT